MHIDTFADQIVINKDGEENFSACFEFPADLTIFDGHFPGNPICPGVAYVFVAERLACRFAGKPLVLKRLKRTKFFAPTAPGDILNVAGSVTPAAENDNILNVQVAFTGDKMQRICSVKMIMEM